ncbi:hypothetical protein M422DRAFT_33756 [Sphaerobolus stellatus SS14]|uniref:N-acetyltransferase domain-containing protein n=1 Tax=Sphaerobolus stellatus (strain SS14) TaxID=990650 RepID=A0A0C9U3L5_SPHS4|nr:hypothetical protein M422DRAFT_33756 [Sphaerobolus stellatus SS14]
MDSFDSVTLPPHEIVVVPSHGSLDRKELYDQCIQVRIEVFVHEQGYDLDTEVDTLDPLATHLLLRIVPSGTPIGTIRVTKPKGASYYKVSRLVVLKEYRKFRLGKELVQAAHGVIIKDHHKSGSQGPIEAVLHAQIYAIGFYRKCGYEPEGDEFEEDGAPHQRMRARLSDV